MDPAEHAVQVKKDERLSWPSWLTCSGRFTHISGHPSAAGRAQDRESSPVRDRRSTTVPRQVMSTYSELIARQLIFACAALSIACLCGVDMLY